MPIYMIHLDSCCNLIKPRHATNTVQCHYVYRILKNNGSNFQDMMRKANEFVKICKTHKKVTVAQNIK